MTTLFALVLAGLLVNLLAALIRVARHPGGHTWVLVLLLTGTTGAAAVPLLMVVQDAGPRALDVSLLLTGLALVATTVFLSSRLRSLPEDRDGDEHEPAPRDRGGSP